MSKASNFFLVSVAALVWGNRVVKSRRHQPQLDGVVRLLELVDLTPHQLHLLHLAMYYARK
jgi:hypothetical protein